MRINRSMLVIAASFLVAPLTVLASPAEAVQTCQSTPLASFLNGSFEQPAFVGQSNYANFSNAQMVGWVSTDPLVSTYPNLAFEIWGNGFIGESAQDGTHFLELESNGAATVYQDFETVPGQLLTWSFFLTPRSGINAFARLAVDVGNVAGTNTISTPVQQITSSWQEHSGSYTVPAGQTTTRLTFVSDQYFNTMDATLQKMVGPNHIDNVQVSASVCANVLDPVPTSAAPDERLANTGTGLQVQYAAGLGWLALTAGLISLYVSSRETARRSR